MNESHDIDSLVNGLDAMAKRDRNEPESGFELRVAEAVRAPVKRHRHRRQRSTAWIPFVSAAAVGAFAFFWWPPSPVAPSDTRTQASSPDSDESLTADIWLASLETMDQLIASDSLLGENIEILELQLDTTESYYDSEVRWSDLGEAL
jgi:predicted small lipoprotein YifL